MDERKCEQKKALYIKINIPFMIEKIKLFT